MVFIMVILGGLTRLTGSGLSITQWQLLSGILPPLNDYDWQTMFQLYQTTPEFSLVNYDMDLNRFKSIFWLEYLHRLWGRLVGLFLLVPFLYLWLTKSLTRRYFWALFGLNVLCALQGVIGWFMVKSGLIDHPHVSPFRLALHLFLAFTLSGGLMWLALETSSLAGKKEIEQKGQRGIVRSLLFLILVTVVFGAFVAGHKAGLLYNTFPLMGDSFLPVELFTTKPLWQDFFTNPVTLQWVHRLLATFILLVIVIHFFFNVRHLQPTIKYKVDILLLIVAMVQVALGIMTLLFHVPLLLALAHQAVAFLLFSLCVVRYFFCTARSKAFNPGSSLPSNHSKKAPPAIET